MHPKTYANKCIVVLFLNFRVRGVLHELCMKRQCHVHKLMFNEGVSLFGFADASQLKMANAFMSEYFWVVHGENNQDLLLLGQAALDMKMLPRAKPFPPNMLDVSLANSKIIKDRSGRHTLPASFWGVRMSKLKHRVANLMHLERLL